MKLVIVEREAVMRFQPGAGRAGEPVAGSLEALAGLHREGWRVVIAVQQASGTPTGVEAMSRMHAALLEAVRRRGGEIDAFFICPHAPGEDCRCRAPRPGLFEEIAERLKVNLAGAWVVGLTPAYVEAARAAESIAVRLTADADEGTGIPVFADLAAFAEELLAGRLTA